MQGHGLLLHDGCGLGELLRGLEFALGGDDLGAALGCSASACFAMARCISCGRSMYFTSTWVTLMPQGSVLRSRISWMCRLTFSRDESDLVELHLPADAPKRRLRELRGGVEV